MTQISVIKMLIKSQSIIIFLCTLISLFQVVNGCAYEEAANQQVERGTVVHYTINTTNTDHLFGVDVKIDIIQSISHFHAENTKFHLDWGSNATTHVYVYTDVDDELIVTQYTIYEKGETDQEYQQVIEGDWDTTIIHPPPPNLKETRENNNNIFLGIIFLSLFGITIYTIIYRGSWSIPFVQGHTRLKREKILENRVRRSIYHIILQNMNGTTLSNIKTHTGIVHNRNIEYHLQRLLQYRYIKKVDKKYYPINVATEKPIITRISEALNEGIKSPTVIAKKTHTSRQRVWYYIQKNGLK